MGALDENIVRIARKLAVLQMREPADVVVPRSVAFAFRELDGARVLAERALHRDPSASGQFIARIGGQAPLVASSRPKSRPLSPAAALLLARAQEGPLEGPMCFGDARGNMLVLQAAFQLDAALGYRDARLTARATDYVMNRREVLAKFEARIDDWSSRGAIAAHMGDGSPGCDGVPIGIAGPQLPGPSGDSLIGSNPTHLFLPGSAVPAPGDPLDPPGPGGGLCQELGDLCAQLFNEFATAAMAEDDAQLIASVEPSCLCAAGFNEANVFTARPDAEHQFPVERGDYQLVFRGQDITDRIVDWSAAEIRFTIPADPSLDLSRA